MSLPTRVQQAVAAYRKALEAELGPRLLRVTVFGSVARGEANEDSDVDVLVLLDAPSAVDQRRALDIGGTVALEWRLPLAPVVLSRAEWDALVSRERLFPKEVERDGVNI